MRTETVEPSITVLVGRVCDEALLNLLTTTFFPSREDEEEVRSALAARVMAAITAGERDPERLKSVALGGA